MSDHRLNRREFLKLVQTGTAAFLLPLPRSQNPLFSIPEGTISLQQLPAWARQVLELGPDCWVDQDGYLGMGILGGKSIDCFPLCRTQWNLEHSRPIDRLDWPARWALVLHWYGDRPGFDGSIPGYLRGFDELRLIAGNLTRTSAHFLVGDARPETIIGNQVFSILQTQLPGPGGVPFLASHLQPQLDLQAHQQKRQYFVRALYALSSKYGGYQSVLQDWYDGPRLDPNWRSLGVELTGYDFDYPDHQPPPQQVANALSTVWALMKRYQIPARDILGHHEIQMDKSDPGKQFLATLRLLLGMKALLSRDIEMRQLVFGSLTAQEYFLFQRDYLAFIGTPIQVFTWEKASSYWYLVEGLFGSQVNSGLRDEFTLPIEGDYTCKGWKYLNPQSHSGIDLYPKAGKAAARLVTGGECLYAGSSKGAHPGKMAIFRHRRPDGTSLLSLYAHLDRLGDLQVGKFYPHAFPVGEIRMAGRERFLHFALAYASSWEAGLQTHPEPGEAASEQWIRERFLDPGPFLQPG